MTETANIPARPKITALAPWFGSKRSLAGEIVRQLGSHDYFFDPMCGSMSVLFAKPPIAFEQVNDLHGDLINLAMVLASDRWQDLCARALRTLPAENLYRACRDILRRAWDGPPSPDHVGDGDVERAWAYLVVSWQGLNGTAGTKTYNQHLSVRWSQTGGRWGWARVPETIPWWHQRLRHVTILHRDAFEVLEKIRDSAGVAIYLDPPYVAKSDRYLHDFAREDHERLARALSRFTEARVVVSYYDHPEVRRLYAGWTIREVAGAKKSLCHSASNKCLGSQAAPELLILNGPSLAALPQAKAASSAPAGPSLFEENRP
ncbi:MAG: DNA adenine methylase [Planctomycetes bacterium]|nr:DNA adenine methylase [Planctomycetota bacterium]